MEEDIKILEEFIEAYKIAEEVLDGDVIQSIDNLVTRYKQLEEENKSKQKAYDDCYCEYKHYKQFDSIPKSKVKEKIEEIEKLKDVLHEFDFKAFYRVKDLRNIEIGILQQLLEDFEETGNHIPIID